MEHRRSKVGHVLKKCKAKQEQIEMIVSGLRAELVPKEIVEQINNMEEATVEPTDKPAHLDKPKDEPNKLMNEVADEQMDETKNEPKIMMSKCEPQEEPNVLSIQVILSKIMSKASQRLS
eukprot:12818744-Ditylum_brightwellii.AAC.2